MGRKCQWWSMQGTDQPGVSHVLFASELYFGMLAVALLVDSNVLSLVLSIAAAAVVSVGDVDFFLGEPSIFPSGARLDFAFYLCDSSFLGSVTPVG